MTNEEKECLIAKACGWKVSDAGWWSHDTLPDNGGAEPEHPWYFTDLNACHEMEKTISLEKWVEYVKTLAPATYEQLGVCHATAAQRAEAFGLTLNLWS